jgi:hypothetical protein
MAWRRIACPAAPAPMHPTCYLGDRGGESPSHRAFSAQVETHFHQHRVRSITNRPAGSRGLSTRPPFDTRRQDSAAVRTDRLAHVLDTLFRIPGTRMRFGLDPILGLIPGVGDATGILLSTYLIIEAARTGASRAVLLRMLFNVGVDSLLSVVPLVGDLLDAGWKSNTRNLALLRRHLGDPRGADSASRSFITMVLIAVALLIVIVLVSAVVAVRWIIGLF